MRPRPDLKYSLGIHLKQLTKTTKDHSKDSQYSGRDLNPDLPNENKEYGPYAVKFSTVRRIFNAHCRNGIQSMQLAWKMTNGLKQRNNSMHDISKRCAAQPNKLGTLCH
jgi:hypothetical protein